MDMNTFGFTGNQHKIQRNPKKTKTTIPAFHVIYYALQVGTIHLLANVFCMFRVIRGLFLLPRITLNNAKGINLIMIFV